MTVTESEGRRAFRKKGITDWGKNGWTATKPRREKTESRIVIEKVRNQKD